ncbi:hypothetical protein HME9302_00004 [Alteripontixanthobacter maritimus]|uniref:Uncharacterized protein n=1 Tax=Alteripontixanthobacter maritimus TaxID=2161824 RepID=A0A369QNU3_9SPHN|nr:hypothetical protein HME9302_00004 [Alteripontixanthobacter maritimus]
MKVQCELQAERAACRCDGGIRYGFDTLDLRNAEDEEYWLHLRHGETKLYADMDKQEGPCRVRVASPAVTVSSLS